MTNFQKCEKCGCKIEKYEFIKNENDLSKYGWWIEKFSREIHSKNKCEIFVKSKRFHKSRIRTNIANWFINHNSIYVNPVSLRNFFLASTGNLRTLPDFLIVGVAKSGTTSMYNYLIEHPTIHPINIEKEYRYPLKKEVRFFDRYYNLGTRWYKAHFPLKFSKFVQKNLKKNSFLTGESTPAYFHNPLVPKRVKQLLPKVKLIFLLRNPIERAFSHYKHNKKLNFENLTFEEAIKIESKRLEDINDTKLIITSPLTGSRIGHTLGNFKKIIETATKEIILVGYVFVNIKGQMDPIVESLLSATSRGVSVKIFFQKGASIKSLNSVWKGKPSSEVPELYIFDDKKKKNKGVLHAKALIKDDDTILVTSANLTGSAMEKNLEFGISSTSLITLILKLFALSIIKSKLDVLKDHIIIPLPGS